MATEEELEEADLDDQADAEEVVPVHLTIGARGPAEDGVDIVAGDRLLPPYMRERAFWEAYVWSGNGGQAGKPDGFGRYQLRLHVSDTHALLLDSWFEDYLYLLHPDLAPPNLSGPAPFDGSEPSYLGMFNDYHDWHPYVLRWEELEVVARCVSRRAGLPHPSIPLLALARFCWPDPEQRAMATAALCAAFAILHLFDTAEIEGLVEGYNWRDVFTHRWAHRSADGSVAEKTTEFRLDRRWTSLPRHGWVMEGEDGYSARKWETGTFPFAAFNDFVRTAQGAAP
jgi:hypothetical protein